GKKFTEEDLTALANETYNKKNQWKAAAGQIFSPTKLAKRLYEFKTPQGYLKEEYIREAIQYYSKISGIPTE
ncbi:MAG: hypothetical protein ACTSSH_05750, partial [Candidatus Heimdallarchaeota archaeon]